MLSKHHAFRLYRVTNWWSISLERLLEVFTSQNSFQGPLWSSGSHTFHADPNKNNSSALRDTWVTNHNPIWPIDLLRDFVGRSKGVLETRQPPLVHFIFQFHAVFGNKWPKKEVWGPTFGVGECRLGNLGSATDASALAQEQVGMRGSGYIIAQ